MFSIDLAKNTSHFHIEQQMEQKQEGEKNSSAFNIAASSHIHMEMSRLDPAAQE